MKLKLSMLFFLALTTHAFSKQTDINHVYGYWRFDKNHFKEVHPMWIGWMIKKAMNTRLFISENEYIQYMKPKKVYGSIRPIVDMSFDKNKWIFKRKEKSTLVPFQIYHEDGKWFFKEGKKVYQVHKDNDLEIKAWYESK